MEVNRIKMWLSKGEHKLSHNMREVNMVADHLTNFVLGFVGTQRTHQFYIFLDFPVGERSLINADKAQLPNLRINTIRKFEQN